MTALVGTLELGAPGLFAPNHLLVAPRSDRLTLFLFEIYRDDKNV